jgi:hypothetical protein
MQYMNIYIFIYYIYTYIYTIHNINIYTDIQYHINVYLAALMEGT